MIGYKRLLIIEDDIDMVEAMRVVLGERYLVDNAFSTDEGFQKIKSEKTDLIILSALFGSTKRPDGFYFAMKVKQESLLAKIPILMITAVNIHTVEFGFPFNFDKVNLPVEGLLNKPVQPVEILSAVEKLLSAGGHKLN